MPGIRLYGLEQSKALQANCEAPQGSAKGSCEVMHEEIIKAYEDIRLLELSTY
jgi:hypothetical protein